jgi:hypothetical protein
MHPYLPAVVDDDGSQNLIDEFATQADVLPPRGRSTDNTSQR